MQWFDRASIPKRPAGLLNNATRGLLLFSMAPKANDSVFLRKRNNALIYWRQLCGWLGKAIHKEAKGKIISTWGYVTFCSWLISAGQNGRHFTDDILWCIFVNEKFCILIKISLKGPIDNIPALVLIMAWRGIGEKPLSEPMLIRFTDAYMRY